MPIIHSQSLLNSLIFLDSLPGHEEYSEGQPLRRCTGRRVRPIWFILLIGYLYGITPSTNWSANNDFGNQLFILQ